jgi:hypothetical protein
MLEDITEKDLNFKNFSNFVLLQNPKVPYINLEAHRCTMSLCIYYLRFLSQNFVHIFLSLPLTTTNRFLI